MKNSLLLSNKFKRVGWILIVLSVLLFIYFGFTSFSPNWLDGKMLSVFPPMLEKEYFVIAEVNFGFTIFGIMFIVGGLFVIFSQEKNEDEFISKIRLTSMLWAVLVHFILLIICFIFAYDLGFLGTMIYNMFTILIIFIIRFNFILFLNTKKLANAE